MLNRGMLVLAAVWFLGASVANGYTLDQIVVENWSGAGANRAVMVVDFGGGDSFNFGYRWDNGQTVTRPSDAAGYDDFIATGYGTTVGANVSEGMMLTISAANPGLIDFHYDSVMGIAVNGFDYSGHSMASDGWVTTYMSFWVSGAPAYEEQIWSLVGGQYVLTDTIDHLAAAGDGENWSFSNWGVSTRPLEDGFYDGWTQGNAVTWNSSSPVVRTPEPATMLLLAAGASVLLRRRNNRV